MKAYLVIVEGSIKGQVHVLPEGGTRVIGRASDADWPLSDSQVSRHHCVVWLRQNKVYLRDLVSRNGTFIKTERIEPLDAVDNEHPDLNKDRIWEPGETLFIGDLLIELVLEDQPDAIRPAMRIVVPGQIEEIKEQEQAVEIPSQNTLKEISTQPSQGLDSQETVPPLHEIKVAKLAVDKVTPHSNRIESLVLSQASRAPLAEQIRTPKQSEQPERISKIDLEPVSNPNLSRTQPTSITQDKKRLVLKKKT